MVSNKAQETGNAIRRFGQEEGSRGPDEVKDESDRSTLLTAVRRVIAVSGNKRTQELEDAIVSIVVDGVPPKRPATNYRPSGPTRIISVDPGTAEDDPTLRTKKSVTRRLE